MARMSIDDMLGRDSRLLRLAKSCGWSRRETAGCLVLDVWPLCYDRERHELTDDDIDAAADMDGFAQLMCNVGLAVRVKPGVVRVSGAKERIRYLQSKRAAGYRGGLKSAESRNKEFKQNSSTRQANSKQTPSTPRSTQGSTPQASGNPSASASASASAPDPSPVPDQVTPPAAPSLVLTPVEDKALTPYQSAVAFFDTRYRNAYGSKPTWGDKQGTQIKRLLKAHGLDEFIRRTEILFTSPPSFLSGTFDLGTLEQHFDKLAKPASATKQPVANRSQTAFDAQMERVRQLEDEEKEGAA